MEEQNKMVVDALDLIDSLRANIRFKDEVIRALRDIHDAQHDPSVKVAEKHLPLYTQETIRNLRQELTFATRALNDRNAQLKALRHEVRLLRRIMRLKGEGERESDVLSGARP